MAVEREVSRFGVPVSLRDARAAGTLLATALDSASAVDSTTVITCAGWKELELAGRDRNYQYALNNADLVLPRDPELLDVLCEGRPDSGSYTHMTPFSAEFFRLCAASGKRVFILTGDSISPTSASRMYAARAHGMEILGAWQIPAEGSDTGSLLAKLAACRPDVLLIAGAGKSTDEWVALHRAVLSVPLILSLALEEQAPQSARSVPTLERLQQISRRFSRSREISAGRWWRQLTLQAGMKRALDLCCASLGLLILSPVLLTTATLIRLESEGPVLFRQRRVGLRGRTFTMFKFRSMYADAEARLLSLRDRNESEGNTLFKMKRDPRVTLVGRFIRRFSIDELPQLINVLRGDMAVVGPRPALPSEVEGYDLEARKRLQVKPGLTCFWQIGGRSDLSFDDQIKLDLDYMGSQSVAQDFSIVLKTVPAVLSGKGAY